MEYTIKIKEQIENINDTFRSMINMAHIVTVLTNDVSLNPEYQ